MYTETTAHIAGKLKKKPDAELSQSVAKAVRWLQKARRYAQETAHNPWDFAITIAELRRAGVSENDIRWLVCRGYVEHAKEITSTSGERAFDRRVNLRFFKSSAFIITDLGLALGVGSGSGAIDVKVESTSPREPAQPTPQSVPWSKEFPGNRFRHRIVPKWDRDRRELRLGEHLVKVFKLPSPMQEVILMAFEEENWPPRIDDPLPMHPDLLPKRRLHDTIKSLNRNQKNCLIRFMGDGTGEGIRWELTSNEIE
jgi:hypothetical protein